MSSILSRLLQIFSTDIAMDLGTANTLLYTRKRGIIINEPSVVALDARDNSIMAIGARAREFIGRTPAGIKAVRPLKDGVIADFDVTRAMISTFAKRTITGLKIARPGMVICIPSGITQVEKRAVIDAARLAGARDVRLIEEPMAAAMGANLPIEEPVGNMVVDIGGGTSEVAIISMCGVSTSKSLRVAGDAMNMAVPMNNAPTLQVSGKDTVQGFPRSVTVNEGHIREAISEQLGAILNTVLSALDKAPPELAADVSRNGILLAGGGSLLKGLDQFLSRETRLNVYVDSDPLTTVLRGTARAMLDPARWHSTFIN